MTLDTSGKKRRSGARLMVLCALLLGSTTACDRRYSHGRIPVDSDTKHRWDAGEKEAESAGEKITPLPPDKDSPEMVPRASLKSLLSHVFPSNRHGADDKRLLSDPNKPFLSSNIVARIVLVKGSEYKSEKEFEKGWIPVAIVYRSLAKERSRDVYEELQLQPAETSWVFVRKLANSTWQGSIVSPEGNDYKQSVLRVTTAKMGSPHPDRDSLPDIDALEPVIGARFVWDDNDESIWAYCGGKCCQMRK